MLVSLCVCVGDYGGGEDVGVCIGIGIWPKTTINYNTVLLNHLSPKKINTAAEPFLKRRGSSVIEMS